MSNILGTKGNILDLALVIGGLTPEETYVCDLEYLETFFDEVLVELAKSPGCPLVSAVLLETSDGEAEYSFPADAQRLVAAFYDQKQLSRTSVTELEALNVGWRDREGSPWAWTLDREPRKKLMLYPAPDQDGDAAPPGGFTWGASFPENNLAMIFGESRDDDIGDWMALYLVFEVLAREFERLSDHQNLGTAKLYTDIAGVCASMGGLKHRTDASEGN